MPKTSAELKAQAKEQLKGRWGQIIVATLVVIVIMIAVGLISRVNVYLGDIISLVVTAPLSLGLISYTIKFAKNEDVEASEVFSGFNRFVDAFVLNLLIGIFTFLWTLLLIVPGIIKGFSYSMSFYILAENPNMKASEALEWSKKITEGHKGRIFYVGLSFIGWSILATFTAGIGFIWLVPYINVTMANLYADIKELNPEYNAIVVGAPSEEAPIYETNHN